MPAPQTPAIKVNKKSKKSQKSSPAQSIATTIDSKSRIQAGLSIIYGAQMYRDLDDADAASGLLDLYIQNNTTGIYDICRRGDDIVICNDIDHTNSASGADSKDIVNEQIVANRLSAILERASLYTTASDQYIYLSQFVDEVAGSAAVPAQKRAFLLQTIAYALEANDGTAAQNLIDKLTIDDTWTATEKAQLAYDKGRCMQLAFESVALEFPIRVLRKRIEEKAKKRQQAEKFYREAIGYRSASISTAAAYALAQMALHFRDAFRELPPPQELANDPDALEEYTTWIEDELVFPAEDAAASLLDVAHQITLQLEAYTTYSHRSAQALAELKPDEYPVIRPSVSGD